MKEWQAVGPAAQILIDVILHHVNKGDSPAEAAETVRTALDGSISSIARDHWMDQGMNRVTVFGGTGFLGRRVVRHLCESGATVRIASRHPGRAEGSNVEQIAADANNERSVEAAVLGARCDQHHQPVCRARTRHIPFSARGSGSQDRERGPAGRGQTGCACIGNRRRRGLVLALYS